MKHRFNISGFIILISYVSLLGVLAIGFPQKICLINRLEVNCMYGAFTSYVIIALLFWVFTKDIKLYCSSNIENHSEENT